MLLVPPGRMRRSRPSPALLASAAATALCMLTGVAGSRLQAAPAPTAGQDATAIAASTLLAKRCVQCHGAAKMSGLDLRTRAAALAGGTRGQGLVPGKPEESSLYLFAAGKGAVRMPPTGSLSPVELDLLRRWIASGAAWPQSARSEEAWWAFRPLKAPAVPAVRQRGWVRNGIDAFVLAELEKKGLKPAPPASRAELLRRVTFDLTGLPPTPTELDAFLADRRPDAYERVVDRLLASPAYGERWARHWLDVARFAESQGFERDKIRDNAWRYRDYVIRSLNEDKPYDRFVREQIAGDVLPDATPETIVATGFLVAGPWDEVGNTQASAVMRARVREDELEDIVSAVGQTFLGLTVNCARCHNHKFDPIPQADYYRLQAALSGVHHGDRALLPAAEIQRLQTARQQLRERIALLEGQRADPYRVTRQRLVAQRLAERTAAVTAAAPRPVARWTFEGDTRDSVGSLHTQLVGGAMVREGALRLNGVDGLARTGPLPWNLTEKTLEAWVRVDSLDQRGGSVFTVEDEPGRTFDAVVFGEREPRKWMAGSNGFYRTQDLTAPAEDTPPNALVHMAVTYAADHRITVFRNGKPYAGSYLPKNTPEPTLRTYSAGNAHIQFGLRHSEAASPGDGRWFKGSIEEARLYNRALRPEEVAASFAAGPPIVTPAELQAAALPSDLTPRENQVEAELRTAREQLAVLERQAAVPVSYAANPQAPPLVYVLDRGDLSKRKELVSPSGLSCLSTLPGDLGLSPDAPDADRRRKLADWLTDPPNPLPARVMANRVWQYHFGRGLAASPSDFGVNGERPTHPELLDWLASRFAGKVSSSKFQVSSSEPHSREVSAQLRNQGGAQLETRNSKPETAWSLKALHRLIVTSATYRQSVQFNPRAAAVDADDHLLWRMPARRLEAEEVRDAMLSVSGELNPAAGGPGFRPFSVLQANSNFYTYEDRVGPEYNRRSIYRTAVNSGGIPLLEALDCPDPSVKTPRRGSTVTPIQALSLLNNSFVLRQARALAARLEKEAGAAPEHQAERAYLRAYSRRPTAAEQARAADFIRAQGLPAFCRVLFNSSEFLYLR